MTRCTAIVDIGKTNAKLLLSDQADGRIVWAAERAADRPPPRLGVPCRELDVTGIETWLRGALAEAARIAPITRIVPIAHGAALVVIAADGSVLAAPDYEDAAFDKHRDAYAPLRDPYHESCSPSLPLGLNLGRQLFHLEREAPALMEAADAILLWPQYWAWRLCGVAASELTSLGSHSDLWRPREGRFSALAERRRWAKLLPPLRRADEVLGQLRPEVAAACGLSPHCAVLCGMHDSSASFHAMSGFAETVISSGTWTIIMTRATSLERLVEARDMLANVDIGGTPVAVARAMGGREYAAVAGEAAPAPTPAALANVIERGALALPSFAAGGPFQGQRGIITGAEALTPPGRAALATLYVALLADEMLRALDAGGPVVVDGPLAANPLFAPVLQALRPDSTVHRSRSRDGVVSAANALALGRRQPAFAPEPVARIAIAGLDQYRHAWRARSAPPMPTRA
jgi:L-fuculokinase